MKTNTTLTVAGRNFFGRALMALLVLALGLGAAPKASAASGFFNDYIIVTGSGTSNGGTYYYHANATFNNAFQGANLGSYDRNSGSLRLNGAEVNTFENGGDAINADSTFLFFRVYRQTAANGDAGQGLTFRGINLPQAGGPAGNGDRRFQTTNGTITLSNSSAMTVNLISLTSGPGTYVVEAFIRASGVNGGTKFRIFDSNSSANYKATFTVTSASAPGGPAATTWVGGINPGNGAGGCIVDNATQTTSALIGPSNWFDPFNWTNGVPTQVTDVEVPNYNTNPCVVYPNIRTTAQTGPAYVRNLSMRGNNPADRSIVRLVVGSLRVYGNIVNPADSYIQRANTTIVMAGGNQSFEGSQTYYDFAVDGGGRKTLSGSMKVLHSLIFINGILVTGTANPVNTNVTLDTGASIVGESDVNYLEGIVIDAEVAVPGQLQAFGDIGLDLTFTSGNPGETRVTRTTGFSAAGLLAGKPGIKRTYGIQPTNANSSTNVLLARMGFRYLDHEYKNVSNSLSPTPQNLNETQLTIWISTSGGSGFANQSRDRIDPTFNRVTQNNINTFATTTLGENASPLPVNFLYFTAGRQNGGALLNWGTAQEKDNAGFEVQASTNGREFRTLTTVKPVAANSSAPQHYSYTDFSNNSGTVYYRLRQVDTDGVYVYTPVRTVNFAGASLDASSSSAFPNPFTDTEQLMLSVQSDKEGMATVSITDALGREVTRSQATVPSGGATLPLPSLTGKPAGLYLVHLTLPSGVVKTVRVQKQ